MIVHMYNSYVSVYVTELLNGWTDFNQIFFVFEWVPEWFKITIGPGRWRCNRILGNLLFIAVSYSENNFDTENVTTVIIFQYFTFLLY